MTVTLEELVRSIGTSVQAARYAVEAGAVGFYLEEFTRGQETDPYIPRTIRVQLPRSAQPGEQAQELEVPVTALLGHCPLRLEETRVHLRLAACEESGQLAFQLGGALEGRPVSELELHFKSTDTPEGMARLHQHSTRIL